LPGLAVGVGVAFGAGVGVAVGDAVGAGEAVGDGGATIVTPASGFVEFEPLLLVLHAASAAEKSASERIRGLTISGLRTDTRFEG